MSLTINTILARALNPRAIAAERAARLSKALAHNPQATALHIAIATGVEDAAIDNLLNREVFPASESDAQTWSDESNREYFAAIDREDAQGEQLEGEKFDGLE